MSICTRCGKCCLTIPCIFAQIRYKLSSKSKIQCPELVKESDGYRCLLIEKDDMVRNTLITGDCDDPAKAQLKKQFDVTAIVKEFFPNASDSDIEEILWTHTGYPNFWNIPKDGMTATQCLRTQLARLAKERTIPVKAG